MFRLKATLVPTTVMRPWRTGWSVDRGVDFSLAPTTALEAAPAIGSADAVNPERRCFVDEDWIAPAGETVVRSFVSTAAAAAAPEPDEAPETEGLRAWWSLAGKPSRT